MFKTRENCNFVFKVMSQRVRESADVTATRRE